MTAIEQPPASLPHPHAAASPFSRDVGAVVLGGDYQGLGIVRSLGRQGVPVCVVDDERSIARLSRHAASTSRSPTSATRSASSTTSCGIARRRGLEGWVLFPTRDETVAAIARNRDRLSEFFRVADAALGGRPVGLGQAQHGQLAEQAGVPAPRSWQPATLGELDAIDSAPPWAIKPAIKEHFFYATKAKAWRADTRAELRELVERAWGIAGQGQMIVQELIPGDGRQQYAYCALYGHGRPLATMVARRRRQHPPDFGRASTFVETLEEPEVEALSERILRRIGYDGLVELEFKRDPRDGSFKLLDFNARTWGYHTIAPAAGVDFPYLSYRHALGLPVEPQRATPGVRWVRLLTDLPTGFVQIRAGDFTLRQYLRTLRSAHVEAVFSREDPLPGLAEVALLPYLMVKRGF